jgi:hypothetical protein
VINWEQELGAMLNYLQTTPMAWNVSHPLIVKVVQLRDAVKSEQEQALTPKQMYENHPIVRAEREANGGMDSKRHNRPNDADTEQPPGDHRPVA